MSPDLALPLEYRRQLQSTLDALRDSAGYRAYQHVLERFFAMKDFEAAGRPGTPSAYWREELEGFEYLLDASPLIIDKLRQHTYHVTGLRPHDYRTNQDKRRLRFAKKLDALVDAAGSRDLLIPEPPALGGYGHEIDGQRFNLDTLKFFEVLITLERGAVLQEFRAQKDRRVVWEIGAGWGGFPYQFKTLCPNVTYVITDLPELFLFSSTYLLTLFPGAKARFFGEVPPERTFDGWEEFDFIFIPNTAHELVKPERVDLTINMVSFQEMTTAQVSAYVRQAYDWNCPFLYSLNRDRSPHNTELTGVWEIVDRHYWSHEYKILPVSYVKMIDEEPGPPDREYKHVIGWRRMTTG